MTRFRIVGRAAAVLAGVALLSGCVSPQTGSNTASTSGGECPVKVDESVTTKANIAWQPIPNTDLVVKDMGWLEACLPNAAVTWSKYSSGADVVQAFGANSADIGLAGSGPAVKMLSAPLNLDVKVVWIHDVIGDAESLVTQEELGSVTDLKGKSIGVPFGSTAQYSLLAALEESGLTSADVNLINLQPDAMLAAWEREEIDAAWVWDPTLSELTKSGTVLLSSAQTAEDGRPTFDLGTATTAFIEANPQFMNIWTELQSAAATRLNNEPELAAESIAAELGISVDEALAQMKGYKYLDASAQKDAEYFGGGLTDALVSTGEFLATQDLIDSAASEDAYGSAPWSDAIEAAAE